MQFHLFFHRVAAPLCLVALLFAATVLLAQDASFNAGLNGGGTFGTATVQDADGSSYNLVATANGVFATNTADVSTVSSSAFFYGKVYTAPAGRTIEQITQKLDTVGAFTVPRNRSYVAVLLDDGTVVELDCRHISSGSVVRTVLGTATTGGPSTWSKIVGDALYALGPGVYVSRDTGKTWSADSAGLGGFFIRDIALDSTQFVYGATTGGLFKQHPDSSVWHKITTLAAPTSFTSVYVDRMDRIFATGASNEGLVMSTDGGATWTFDTTDVSGLTVRPIGDDALGNIYAAGPNSTFYKSTGGTGAWTRIDAGITALTGNPATVYAITGDTLLVIATNFGAYVTLDQGTTWYEANGGVLADRFYGFARNKGGRFLVSTDLGIFYHDPGDTVWHKCFPESGYLGALPLYKDTADRVYTVMPNPDVSSFAEGPVFKSTDDGLTWNTDTVNISSTTGKVFFVDERGGGHIGTNSIVYPFAGRVYAQDSTGKWVIDTTGLHASSSSYVSSFGSDRAGKIYMSGTYPGSPRVFSRSIDGGSWTVDTIGLPAALHSFQQMKQGAIGDVYGTDYHLMFRHNAGVWSPVPLPSSSVFKFTVDKTGAIFAVTTGSIGIFLVDIGIAMSTDDGATWAPVTNDTVQVDGIHSRGDTSYALLENGTLYTLTRAGIVSAVRDPNHIPLPSVYALEQSYPNPFNPSATIQYHLAVRSVVSLRIFNALGQQVAVLKDGIEEPGDFSVRWSAGNVASGAYFYRFEASSVNDPAEKFSQTRKMVLIK